MRACTLVHVKSNKAEKNNNITKKKQKIQTDWIDFMYRNTCMRDIDSDSTFRMLMSYFLFIFLFFLYVIGWLTGCFFYHCLDWHCVIVFFISINEIIFNSNFEGPIVYVLSVCGDEEEKRTNRSRVNVSFICVRSLLFFSISVHSTQPL